MKSVDQVLFEMLKEHTGESFLDSGGAYGRNYERFKGLTLQDVKKQPEIVHDKDSYTINVFHLLRKRLQLDHLCHEFNRLNAKALIDELYP